MTDVYLSIGYEGEGKRLFEDGNGIWEGMKE